MMTLDWVFQVYRNSLEKILMVKKERSCSKNKLGEWKFSILSIFNTFHLIPNAQALQKRVYYAYTQN